MFLVVTNNDLDLLALRAAVDDLPDGFGAVRARGGVGLDPEGDLPDLTGVGVDHNMIETDYPHLVSSWPDSQEILTQQLDGVPTTRPTASPTATP